MALLGGADKIVVGKVQRFRQVAEILATPYQ